MAAGSILNNISALGASRQLGITSMGLEKTIQRLTTGKRINMAADDAAGLAISNKIGADIRIANQGRRNAYDGVAMSQVADGVLEEVTSLLTRAAELAEQAATGTISDSNRDATNAEFQKIKDALDNIATNTKFNGQTVFGGNLFVSVGDFQKLTDVKIGTLTAGDYRIKSQSLTNSTLAFNAKGEVRKMIDNVSMMRASIGANMQNMYSIANTLGIQVENFTAAYSQIRDANIADEVINLTKFQVLNQSGTSALGQSNQAAQSVLSLLR
ncbi:MAG: hypothetical protein FWG02_06675 [Holophagaceae bacterium]|nr:hypothetical protein [Holophagaceae bacterium]